MDEALRFFRTYELWIYALLALVSLVYMRRFILAWGELRGAAFGLERESAQTRLNQAAGMLVLLMMIALAEFIMVSFVAPVFPGSNPLSSPTVDLLATATTTLATSATQIAPGEEMQEAASPTPENIGSEGCIPGQVMITEPKDGSEISGVITVKGTANTENFGFYVYEVARPGEDVWLTIQAGNETKVDGDLGQWDTSTLQSADYQLRLVVTDNQGTRLEPCIIQVRVNNPVTP